MFVFGVENYHEWMIEMEKANSGLVPFCTLLHQPALSSVISVAGRLTAP